MKRTRSVLTAAVCLLGASFAGAQTWAPLNHQPGVNVGAMMQLRDGRILVHEEQSGNSANWWILTPDSTGSYQNGTWSSGGQLPSGYKPWFFSSQVLLDGKTVAVEGGEYNSGQQVETKLGAIGTVTPGGPITWVSNNPPSSWQNIGDAPSIILADGRYMQGNTTTNQSAFYNGPNTWIANGNIVGRTNNEAGYTLLPNNKVLLVDAFNVAACSGTTSSELFDPTSNTWACGAPTPSQMWDNAGHELGPAILMFNGKVFQVGAVPVTAVYDPVANSWAAGPTPAGGLDGADAPGVLEKNGKVLVMLSPGEFQSGCQFVEYNPTTNVLANTANPPHCPSDSSYVGHLMVLPTGEIMFTDFSGQVELYTPQPSPEPRSDVQSSRATVRCSTSPATAPTT